MVYLSSLPYLAIISNIFEKLPTILGLIHIGIEW